MCTVFLVLMAGSDREDVVVWSIELTSLGYSEKVK
jgi:hypothetical protein